MKKKINVLVLFSVLAIASISCTRVDAGYVGVKVKLLGSEKGVQQEVVGVGRYYVGVNEELYLYPTYQVNYVYTADKQEGSETNEQFTFQTKEGMECSMDLGLAMHFDEKFISKMFQTYHKGEDEIRSVVVRKEIRNALNRVAGNMPVESVYGEGKGKLIDSVQSLLKNKFEGTGIVIDDISLIGSIRIPQTILNALNSKVQATQDAMKVENEVRKATANSEIKIANARGEAQSILEVAKAQAEANRLLSASISQTLVEYKKAEKWNGVTPTTVLSSGSGFMINMK